MRIKIVHLITNLGSGGAEMMLYKLASRMDQEAFENVVVSMTDEGTLGQAIVSAGVPLHVLGMRRGIPDARSLLEFAAFLRRERPCILQTWLYHADFLGLLGSRLAPVPALAWNLRCSDVEFHRYAPLTACVARTLGLTSRLPQVVLVNSEAGRAFHEARLGYRPRRWALIPNGFDTEAYAPNPTAAANLRSLIGVPRSALLIGMVARYDPMKDHINFLQAARQVRETRSEAHFVLTGSGMSQDNPTLMNHIRRLGLDDAVHLLGRRADIPALMPGLDIATLSSAYGEGFPNVVGEAMACGVACAVTDVGDAAMIVGDTGRVVPPRESIPLARAWLDLIDLGPEGRENLGHAARKRIEDFFSLPIVVGKYERLYRELSERPQTRSA